MLSLSVFPHLAMWPRETLLNSREHMAQRLLTQRPRFELQPYLLVFTIVVAVVDCSPFSMLKNRTRCYHSGFTCPQTIILLPFFSCRLHSLRKLSPPCASSIIPTTPERWTMGDVGSSKHTVVGCFRPGPDRNGDRERRRPGK